MIAVEFEAEVTDGIIEIPEPHRDQIHGAVRVILLAGTPAGEDWARRNQRRWQLIAKKATQGLTDDEAVELAALQAAADHELAQVGPRPIEDLEKLYANLSRQE
jgi:hypothetical protein